jgi:hypothetical protein
VPLYHPNARVKLAIRLDEGADTTTLDSRLPSSSTAPPGLPSPDAYSAGSIQQQVQAELEAVFEDIERLTARRDRVDQPSYDFQQRRLREQRDSLQDTLTSLPGSSTPDGLSGAPPDNNVVLGSILPRTGEIFRNGIRIADRCRVTIDYRDAPFDPRLIRSCGIELVLGLVTADDFQRGMRGGEYDGDSFALVASSPIGSTPPVGTTRFLGYVDEWTVNYDGQDGDTIELVCRDLTAPILDQKIPQGTGINLDLQIAAGVSELLNNFASTRGMSVVFGDGTDDGPTPGEAIPRSRRARRGRIARRGRSGGAQMNLWDHITDVCNQVGVVPMVVDDVLRIERPRTFYATAGAARRMVFGRNLEKLTFARKLSATKVPTVEVRSYDPRLGRTRWARFPVPPGGITSGVFGTTEPPRPARANEVPPSGSVPDDKIQTFTLEGISSPSALSAAAESIWEQIGRQELEGSFSTHDAWSWDTPVASANLLTVRSGDAIELLVAAADPQDLPTGASITDAQEIAAMTRANRARFLESIGWSQEVARRFAALQDATQFQTIFRVQNIQLGWDKDEGLQVSIDFINFLEIREDAGRNELADDAAVGRVTTLDLTEIEGDPNAGVISLEPIDIVGDPTGGTDGF